MNETQEWDLTTKALMDEMCEEDIKNRKEHYYSTLLAKKIYGKL